MRKIPWRKKWQPTPVFLPGKSHEQRSLVGYSPWGYKRVEHNLVSKHKQQLWIHGVLIASQTEFALVSCLSLHVLFFFLKALLNLLQLCFCFMFWFLAVRHVRSWLPNPCTGRQSLNHWTTKEVPHYFLYLKFSPVSSLSIS